MKLVTRPVPFSEQESQSRDMAGLHRWAQSSRTISFIMFMLGWFTIPAEVFMRRDFGQRWFTTVNFYAGFFVMLIFATVQYLWGIVWHGIVDMLGSFLNPSYVPEEVSIFDRSMVFFLIAYVLMGSFHLFKIWWRNRTNTALHSFDDGTSRLEPLAALFIKMLNVLAVPLVVMFRRLLPRKQRKDEDIPRLIHDRSAFTNTVFEPLVLLVLAWWFNGITSVWLFISSVALVFYANWKETAKLNKVLDFRDSIIEAKMMMELKNGPQEMQAEQVILHQAAETIKEHPQVAPYITHQYPDLMSIIDEMNTDRSHLAN